MFADVVNPFGTAAFEAPASTTRIYYKNMRLDKKPSLRAPKPLSHHIKNFLLNYDK